MFRKTTICAAALLAAGGGLAGLSPSALAQDAANAPVVQRIEVTGSLVKRIAGEGALPVTTIGHDEIAKAGVTNVTDLMQKLPAMQGFTASSDSVNGSGGGVTTASVHALGTKYTLVLLNGHRVAPVDTGSTVNLDSIPIAAIDRVEVLTDGASALYGSDAVAGVVNFILKKDYSGGEINLYALGADRGGAGKTSVGITKGFGSLDSNGFNVLLSYSHDEQGALNASQRAFSNSGVRRFEQGGQQYAVYQLSKNTAPAAAELTLNDNSKVLFSPDLLASGHCGPNTFRGGNLCRFDFPATVELIPESARDGLYGSARWRLNDATTVYTDLLWSKFVLTSRYAPPAQPLALSLTSPLYQAHVAPFLAQLGVDPASVKAAQMDVRVFDAGGRTDEYRTDTKHAVVGIDGSAFGWDYNASLEHSANVWTDREVGGYMSTNAFNQIVDAGAYDPFLAPGASASVLAPAVLHQQVDRSVSTLDAAKASASGEVFKLPAGAAQLGVGGEVTRQHYQDDPSAILQSTNPLQPAYTDSIIGGSSGALPVDASRNVMGVFGELVTPLAKGLELTSSLRYDHYSKAKNKRNFDPNGNPLPSGEQGNSYGGTTYKIAARYQPTSTLLLRGSYGTGFRAPTLGDITSSRTAAGVTSGQYACPVGNSDPRAVGCQGTTQYQLLSGGNPLAGDLGLKPEKSKQWTLGFRVDPLAGLSLGFDAWDVRITDKIESGYPPENLAFNNPGAFDGLFSVYHDPIGKFDIVALSQGPANISSAHYRGIDFDHLYRVKTAAGELALQWSGTVMLKADKAFPGQGTQSSLGQFGADNSAISRLITKARATLKNGMFTHSATFNYRTGYWDMEATEAGQTLRLVNADGSLGAFVGMSNHRVSSYATWDWQTQVDVTKDAAVTFGIKNLLDRDPPFSIRTAGGGNQVGYDGRYADPVGRQFYLSGSLKF